MGFDTVTLKISDGGRQKTGTISVEDKKILSAVLPNFKDNTVTRAQFDMLTNMARSAGDRGILEGCDIGNAQQKAKYYGYDEAYDIKVSKDGKYLEITVKDQGFFTSDPYVATLIKDFNVSLKTFFRNNLDIIEKSDFNPNDNKSPDNIKVKSGKNIKLPIKECKYNTDGPSGRLIQPTSLQQNNRVYGDEIHGFSSDAMEDYLISKGYKEQ